MSSTALQNKYTTSSPQAWLLASRPKTLPASLVPVLIGAALAASHSNVSFLTLSTIILTSLLLQIATNFANDVYDYEKGADTSERLGPLRVTQAGLISAAQMKKATAFTLLLAICLGSYLVSIGGFPILLIGLLSVICALLYTAGPFPLAYLGLGELFVLVFFGPVAVSGTYFLLTQSLTADVILAGFAPGMLACAILVVNNLRDIDSDRKSGKNTLAVRFGSSFAKIEYVFLVIGAASIPLLGVILFNQSKFSLLACLYLIPSIGLIKTIIYEASGVKLNIALANTAKLLLLYCLFYCLGVFLGVSSSD